MSWTKRVAAGDFKSVLAEADAMGLVTALGQAPLADLVALADAARYTGNVDVARDALAVQRRRFPASPDARAAAFLLGRIAENGGAIDHALTWYDRYLTEAPNGSFAAEALGRRMLATQRQGAVDRARSFATEYLKRFPDGPYADVARGLAGAP